MGPPPAAFEELPPTPEPLELRGPMEGYPCYATHPPEPFGHRILRLLQEKGDDVIQVFGRRLGDTQWTAAALARRACCLARGLAKAGVASGDAVCVVAGAHPEFSPVMLACFLAGAAFVPLNHRFDDGDLRRLLSLTAPRLVLSVAEVAPRLRTLLGAATPVIVLGDGSDWHDLCGQEDGGLPPPPPGDPRTVPAMIACSSGTTGLPKGVVYTRASMSALLDFFKHPDVELGTRGKLIYTSPGFWVTGVWYALQSMLEKDSCVVCEYGANEEEFLEAIEEHKATAIFTASNFLLSVAKKHEDSTSKRDVSSLKLLLCGGAALSPEADAFVQKQFPQTTLISMYGMTELNSGIGITKLPKRKTGSVGKLCPFLRCKVVDLESGRPLGPNQRGELRFKGPCLAPYYLHNQTATDEMCDEDGWLHSGDLGHYDEDEMFFVTGRIKDTIKYRGVHVSPIELEGLLETHPAVLESAVVGVPHPTEQELPRAYVVLRPGSSVTQQELQALVADRMAEHKWLRGGVVFLPALPKTATGKISRADIRRRFVEP